MRWLYRFFSFIFFFFQAEDGIRDDLVTGVQTCALPILIRGLMAEAAVAAGVTPCELSFTGALQTFRAFVPELMRCHGERSEERRVGKECRSRGSPDQ